MTEALFAVELAGRRWSLPHLPFRIIKAVQPALFQVYAETAPGANAPLTEHQIDNLARATWRAIAHVDPDLGFEDFLSMPFSVADLFAVLPSIAQAVGLITQKATAEASPNVGKSISTP